MYPSGHWLWLQADSFFKELCQASAEALGTYDSETERLAEPEVARIKEHFMQTCKDRAHMADLACCQDFRLDSTLWHRDGGRELVEQKLKAGLMDLGFPSDSLGVAFHSRPWFQVAANWTRGEPASETKPEDGCSECAVCQARCPAEALTMKEVCQDCQRGRPSSSYGEGLFSSARSGGGLFDGGSLFRPPSGSPPRASLNLFK